MHSKELLLTVIEEATNRLLEGAKEEIKETNNIVEKMENIKFVRGMLKATEELKAGINTNVTVGDNRGFSLHVMDSILLYKLLEVWLEGSEHFMISFVDTERESRDLGKMLGLSDKLMKHMLEEDEDIKAIKKEFVNKMEMFNSVLGCYEEVHKTLAETMEEFKKELNGPQVLSEKDSEELNEIIKEIEEVLKDKFKPSLLIKKEKKKESK